MTRKECAAMVRRVYAAPDADPAETQLVIDVVLEEMLLQDYDATLALLQKIADAPTKH